MSSSDDFQFYLWYAIYHVPTALAFVFATYLCLTRGRRNPKGAVLLGCALLLAVAQSVLSLAFTFFASEFLATSGGANPELLIYGYQIFISCLSGAVWVLVALAVFARTPADEIPDFQFPEEARQSPLS